MKVRKTQTNFTSGHLDPELAGRSNLSMYEDGAAEVINCRILPTGGVKRRPGTLFCTTVPTKTWQHESYVFNSEQVYQFLFSDFELRVFDGQGALLQTITGCFWSAAMIGNLSIASSGDFTFVAHTTMPPQRIQRISATTFVVSAYAFERQLYGTASPLYQPFYRYANFDVDLVVEWVSYYLGGAYNPNIGLIAGTVVNLTMSASFFSAAYVGQVLQVGTGQIEITSYTNATSAGGKVISTDLKLKIPADGITVIGGVQTVEILDPFHGFDPTNVLTISMANGVRNAADVNLNGIKTVLAVTGNTWQFNSGVVHDRTGQGGGPAIRVWCQVMQTRDWSEATYSFTRGYPSTVAFHATRMIFAGGTNCPKRINMSQVEAPYNFDVGTGLDSESIQVDLVSDKSPVIHHVVSSKHLLVFTSDTEFYAPFGVGNKALTPGTILFLPQSNYGVLKSSRPVVGDGATLFVSRTGRSIREMVFGNNDVGYTAPLVSLQANKLIPSATKIASLLEDGEQKETVSYVLNADGSIAVLTYLRKEQVAAWGKWTTNGIFRTICVVDRTVFTVVERVINGATVQCLEKFAHHLPMDCMESASGASSMVWTISGLYASHSTSVVVNELDYIGEYTPSSLGTFTLPQNVSTIWVGMKFSSRIKTLPPELSLQDGPTTGQPRTISSLSAYLFETVEMKIESEATITLLSQDNPAGASRKFSGHYPVSLLGWDSHGQRTIYFDNPTPFHLLALTTEISF